MDHVRRALAFTRSDLGAHGRVADGHDLKRGDVDVTKADPVELRRGMGYVIQQIGLFPHQTIAENILVMRAFNVMFATIIALLDSALGASRQSGGGFHGDVFDSSRQRLMP